MCALSIESMGQRLADQHPPTAKVDLQFLDCGIRVRSNSSELIDLLRAYFEPFVADSIEPAITVVAVEAKPPGFDDPFTIHQPEPPKTNIKEEYLTVEGGRIVSKRKTGMVLRLGGDTNLAIGPCLANANQIVNFINGRYQQWRLDRGGILLHAAGVCHGPYGIAIAGFSGAGKSTLALHLMSHGATFVSNDRIIVDRRENHQSMHGVPKLPRVNPGTILNNPNLTSLLSLDERKEFAALDEASLRKLENKYDVPIDRCFGPDRHVLASSMVALILLNWQPGAGPTRVSRAQLDERQDLFPAFTKSLGVFYDPEQPIELGRTPDEAYLDILEGTPVLEIYGGVNFAAATEACLDLLAMSYPVTPTSPHIGTTPCCSR